MKENGTTLKRTNHELGLYFISFHWEKIEARWGKWDYFTWFLLLCRLPLYTHTFSTSGSLVSLLFEEGGKMHSEIKGKIRWKDRKGEIVVEWGLAGLRRISLKSSNSVFSSLKSSHLTASNLLSFSLSLCEWPGRGCSVSSARRASFACICFCVLVFLPLFLVFFLDHKLPGTRALLYLLVLLLAELGSELLG